MLWSNHPLSFVQNSTLLRPKFHQVSLQTFSPRRRLISTSPWRQPLMKMRRIRRQQQQVDIMFEVAQSLFQHTRTYTAYAVSN